MKYLLFLLLVVSACSTSRSKSGQLSKGDKGERGESAYEIWLKNGGKGSEIDFLNWLRSAGQNDNNLGFLPQSAFSADAAQDATGYLSITALGCKPDMSNDCGKIISQYIASQPVNSFINLSIPYGRFLIASTIIIEDRMVNIRGAGMGRSVLYVAEGVDGIFINKQKGIMSDYILERFSLVALGKKKPGFSGVKMWQRGSLRDLEIQGFSAYGVHIDGFTGGKDDNHDASFSKVYDCFIAACGSDGILVDGKDGNACITQNNDIRNNGGWGIRESSFLGGTHIGNMFHANAKGPYTVDHPTAAVVILGGYTEGDQPPSLLTKKTAVTGEAQHFAGIRYKD